MEFLDALRPFLKAALLPPGSILLLLVLGLLLGRRWLGRLLLLSGVLSLYLLSTPASTVWLARFVETYPVKTSAELLEEKAEAILLLTAGFTRNNPELQGESSPGAYSLQRLSYALKLHRETGLPIIVSGGRLEKDDEPIADIFARWLETRAGVTPLALETRSRNTWENLQYSADLLQELGIKRVALVTHAFHMPRSMLAAEAHSVNAIPTPHGLLGAKAGEPVNLATPSMWTVRYKHIDRNYLILHELLGMTWYRFKS